MAGRRARSACDLFPRGGRGGCAEARQPSFRAAGHVGLESAAETPGSSWRLPPGPGQDADGGGIPVPAGGGGEGSRRKDADAGQAMGDRRWALRSAGVTRPAQRSVDLVQMSRWPRISPRQTSGPLERPAGERLGRAGFQAGGTPSRIPGLPAHAGRRRRLRAKPFGPVAGARVRRPRGGRADPAPHEPRTGRFANRGGPPGDRGRIRAERRSRFRPRREPVGGGGAAGFWPVTEASQARAAVWRSGSCRRGEGWRPYRESNPGYHRERVVS